ncbi:indolepyruvate ferredoxin oxidoreductase subunit alpha [Ruminococcus callidus]|jgi:indolepyruvate ferredoxin oxidoreductase alpha subunit|uniref:indolepyruvate ferredoxin oxidoreductase subunit alpha n=1 Tax=Ruminococcus callidus TaxID=40519 RepID=UPI000EF0C25F|nr:indolepyruvate ferredoxin oxidoreductase subunit alpha [Ruminococcus callidus]HCD39608.1 indolepyruvate ferredoxin oxidoreductase subunit alpha [Ruminococcus sp.]HCY33845.1 indolepyruvate ferredoxin oxidoreductase subunit alpha [Ruminococcus sp.]
MHTEFLMGNAAIAMGAIAAGLNVVSGYPGTPSTEVLETTAKHNDGSIYVEWSTNEKAAMELAAGAAYCGARTMVTMKQVGLNVASDPLMSLAYIGVKGGMVILVADDPGPISSQTEQDTRRFAAFSKLPCFDPSGVQEAYDMIQEAFAYSERYHTPVLFRPTTRVCHGYASITVKDAAEYQVNSPEGFVKDSSKWVIFPKLSYQNHIRMEKRNTELQSVFSGYPRNRIYPETDTACQKGIATHGISFSYTMEALHGKAAPRLLKVATPFPFPEQLAVEFLQGLDEVLCLEELDPVIEQELVYLCGKYHLPTRIRGKLTEDVALAGENSCDSVAADLAAFLGWQPPEQNTADQPPELPVRPPVLCAGCPHRASFFAVKEAMKGKKSVFCGDIGCYTLGNAMPLDMVDTCLCMGAGVNMTQGIGKIEPDTTCFAFVGDSTFFASAITGMVNAVYNQANMTLVVLDNSTTAMTGHQPHPGTGKTMMGQVVDKVSIEDTLHGIGVKTVETVNPLHLQEAIDCVKRVAVQDGVKAIIFKSPCAVLIKSGKPAQIEESKCIQCKKCIRTLGCPAIMLQDGKVQIEQALCTGCGLCAQVCPTAAIGGACHA